MPPTTQKVMVTPHEVDHVDENVLSIWVVQHVMEFIHAYGFSLWESDLWPFLRICC